MTSETVSANQPVVVRTKVAPAGSPSVRPVQITVSTGSPARLPVKSQGSAPLQTLQASHLGSFALPPSSSSSFQVPSENACSDHTVPEPHAAQAALTSQTVITSSQRTPLGVSRCLAATSNSAVTVAELKACALLDGRRALVKTVKNQDWLPFVQNIIAPPFRTSVSLPPPGGVGMRLFGEISKGCCGLLWDASLLALTDERVSPPPVGEIVSITSDLKRYEQECKRSKLSWPNLSDGTPRANKMGMTGTIVKLNLDNDTAKLSDGVVWVPIRSLIGFERYGQDAFIWPSGYNAKTEHNMRQGKLVNGREEATVSMGRLIAENVSLSYTDVHTKEVIHIGQSGGLLPFNEINFNCTGVAGIAAIFVRSAEARYLLFALGVGSLLEHALGLSLPLLLLDSVNNARPISRAEALSHLRAFLKDDAARVSPNAVLTPRLPLDLRSFPELTVQDKILFHGSYGVTTSSLQALLSGHNRDDIDNTLAQAVALASAGLQAAVASGNIASAREVVRASALVMMIAGQHRPRQGSDFCLALPVQELMQQSLVSVHHLCEKVGHGPDAEGMLVALGAQVVLSEFCAGRTTSRLEDAAEEVRTWLEEASGGYPFLLRSWMESRRKHPDSSLWVFMSGQAAENRARMLSRLEEMQKAVDGASYLRQLMDLVTSLHKPCTRLDILRNILGLDDRFSRDVVHGIICLAHDIVTQAQKSPFGVDEATRLEAEEYLKSGYFDGTVVQGGFCPDPLGAKARHLRARYRMDRSRK